MKIYYYTGEGTTTDVMFARSLSLVKDQLVELVEHIQVPHTSIEYFMIRTISKDKEISRFNRRCVFTNRAIKPFISDFQA